MEYFNETDSSETFGGTTQVRSVAVSVRSKSFIHIEKCTKTEFHDSLRVKFFCRSCQHDWLGSSIDSRGGANSLKPFAEFYSKRAAYCHRMCQCLGHTQILSEKDQLETVTEREKRRTSE